MNGQTSEPPVLAEPTQDERAYAGLAHALMIPTWWIAPLIIFLIKRESRFVKFHALQALFWQIIFTCLYVAGMVVLLAGMFATMPQGKTAPPSDFPFAIFGAFMIYWLVMMGGVVVSFILGIVYCLKAMRGEWAGYPLIGRWAKRISGA